MYKLFLALKYLRRRYIGLVAVAGMALCVAMVLIVISVMKGFLAKLENAAKGMMGDITIDAPYMPMGRYDEYIAELTRIPGVQSATPIIYMPGLMRTGSGFTRPVTVVGIRLFGLDGVEVGPDGLTRFAADRVSTFRQSLWPDSLKENPTFQLEESLATRAHLRNVEVERELTIVEQQAANLEAGLDAELAKPPEQQDRAQVAAFKDGLNELDQRIAALRARLYRSDRPGVILGSEIPGTTDRDPATGAITRGLFPGVTIQLVMLPIGRQFSMSQLDPVTPSCTYLGDSTIGVYQVDSQMAYISFQELQRLLGLGELVDEETGRVDPPRTHQIIVKTAHSDDLATLQTLIPQMQAAWKAVQDKYPDQKGVSIIIQTWREKQAAIIDPIASQETLVTLMFGVISLVAVVLVFAIFYMIVVQKTRDIGVIKTIGGSSMGVAGMYLVYGGVIGLVGSILGLTAGWLFVHYINGIHDWIGRAFGWRVFDKTVFLFESIPNQVRLDVMLGIAAAAIVSGVLGALLPAIRAARMQPVEALRYE